ncbi:hypothetical protein E1263_05030 [Kribbella antibiotica]|uniref:Uncharacterized protein n=1 Tax=Kribbella antibiotica TaxID=190195 RepID=A0A4R4ZT44_9ACTN|nr:hypothetical protein [Kribbella antibiotica]TDD61985.1 hypothetical protein E1263_05030 [Kribbella antibiotica]
MTEGVATLRKVGKASPGVEWKAARRFHLITKERVPQVVAEGAVWSSGAIALHHPGYPPSTSIWAGIHDVLSKYGADYEIEWVDAGPEISRTALPQPAQPARNGKGWPLHDADRCKGIGE